MSIGISVGKAVVLLVLSLFALPGAVSQETASWCERFQADRVPVSPDGGQHLYKQSSRCHWIDKHFRYTERIEKVSHLEGDPSEPPSQATPLWTLQLRSFEMKTLGGDPVRLTHELTLTAGDLHASIQYEDHKGNGFVACTATASVSYDDLTLQPRSGHLPACWPEGLLLP